jgi:hypothetical protein
MTDYTVNGSEKKFDLTVRKWPTNKSRQTQLLAVILPLFVDHLSLLTKQDDCTYKLEVINKNKPGLLLQNFKFDM